MFTIVTIIILVVIFLATLFVVSALMLGKVADSRDDLNADQ